MIRVQTVCKDYKQRTKVAASKETVNPKISIQTLKYFKIDTSMLCITYVICNFDFF